MLFRVCSACGHTNFSFSRRCMGCGEDFPRGSAPVAWRNTLVTVLLALLLLGICGAGLFQLLQRVLPPLRALILGA